MPAKVFILELLSVWKYIKQSISRIISQSQPFNMTTHMKNNTTVGKPLNLENLVKSKKKRMIYLLYKMWKMYSFDVLFKVIWMMWFCWEIVAEFKEFERRFKFKPRLKYGWFHLKLYQMFSDLSRRLI